MKKTALISFFCACGVAAFGSTITSVSTGAGGPITVTEPNPDVEGGNHMGGMLISATFFGEIPVTCTWSNGLLGCTNAGNFSIGFPANTQTDPDVSLDAGVWTITNLRGASTNRLVSLTIDALVGNIGFDRCFTGGVPNDGDHGYTLCNGGTDNIGTTGSLFGWSAGNALGGTTGVTADATYFNELKIAAQAAQGDAWGGLTLAFGGEPFNGSDGAKETFTFRADTDEAVSSVPEPATLGLMGLALAGLGALRFRRR